MMTNHVRIPLFAALAAAVLLEPAGAAEILQYADDDGVIQTAQVESVIRDEEEELTVKIIVGGRKRTLKLPARRVVQFRRGDTEAENAWSNQLGRGLRMLSAGQLATEGTNPGAEEVFTKVAYTKEEGIKGQEALFAADPSHNMYALYYLIETRYQMGMKGDKARLEMAAADCLQFKERSTKKKSIQWDIPGDKGAVGKGDVWCWGESRLMPDVMLLEAKILAALERKDAASKAFDEVIDRVKKKNLAPTILTEAYLAKAEHEAKGLPSDQQEKLFRDAGTLMATLARSQQDVYSRQVIARAANRALLRGADLLMESAQQGKFGWDVPLQRYEQLRDGEGSRDPALWFGAQAGVGVCLVEKGEGARAYEALLDVAIRGGEYPETLARALFYLARAATLFAKEVEAAGGKGDFLRAESDLWRQDLKQRYPSSSWAERAQQK